MGDITTRLGVRLGVLLAASVFPLAVLSSGMAWLTGTTAHDAALRAHYESARVFARDAESFVNGTAGAMRTTIADGDILGGTEACEGALNSLLEVQASLVAVSARGPDGTEFCSLVAPTAPLAAVPMPSQGVTTRTAVVIDPAGHPLAELVRTSRDGTVILTAVSLLDPVWARFASSDISSGSEQFLLTEDGNVIAGPGGVPGLRRSAAIRALHERLAASGEPVATTETDDVGLVSIARVGNTPLRVAVVTAGSAPDVSVFFLVLAPLLFLIAAVVVAWWGVDRLVSRWMRVLTQAAEHFGGGDMSARVGPLPGAPTEVKVLAARFDAMAASIEARALELERVVGERGHFLRELHHRVKNNFQMIASLLSLQRRDADPELGRPIREALDRVQALAAAYRVSYAESERGTVSAGGLVRELVDRLAESSGAPAGAVEFTNKAKEAQLELDRAIPYALLVTEIAAAVLDRAVTARVTIHAVLDVVPGDGDRAHPDLVLRITHTGLGKVPQPRLAMRLIPAYLAQLGAETSTTQDETVIRVGLPAEKAPAVAGGDGPT